MEAKKIKENELAVNATITSTVYIRTVINGKSCRTPVSVFLGAAGVVGTLNTEGSESLEPESQESFSDIIYLHKISKTGSYNDLKDKPTIPTVPTNISAFTNDVPYASESYVEEYVSEHIEAGGDVTADNVTITGDGTELNPLKISDEYQLRINAGI